MSAESHRTGGRVARAGGSVEGAVICVFPGEHLDRPYDRVDREVTALVDSGARVIGVFDRAMTRPASQEVTGAERVFISPEHPGGIPVSDNPIRAIRVAGNVIGNALRWILRTAAPRRYGTRNKGLLRQLDIPIDLVWCHGFGSLDEALDLGVKRGIPVVYETLDLDPHRQSPNLKHLSKALRRERESIGQLSGFITACESYADYYDQQFGDLPGYVRPTVHDNAPNVVQSEIRPTGVRRRFLFQGNLHPSKMVREIVHACALAGPHVDVTLQGVNMFPPNELEEIISSLGIADRLRILEPCPLDEVVAEASQYDFGIVALPDTDENSRRASTTKLFVYMAAGLALVGSNTIGIGSLIRRHDNGQVVESGSAQAWAAALNRCIALPAQEVDRMKSNSLAGVERYQWRYQRGDFLRVFENALTQSKTPLVVHGLPSRPTML